MSDALLDPDELRPAAESAGRLLEQLDASLGDDAYRDDGDDGFFDRIKSAFR